VLWVWAFWAEGAFKGGPNGKSFGADYAMFAAAAQVMRHGGNPYDHTVLLRTEAADMRRLHLEMVDRPAVVRVGNPPTFFWALGPLAAAPFQPAALAWIIGLYVLSLVGAVASLAYLGWRNRPLPSLVFMLMPEVFLGAFYGNVICLVFAALAGSLFLVQRRPFLAGVLLALAWLKPPVALPIALLIFLFQAEARNRVAGGFALATLGGLLVTVAAGGPGSLVDWLIGLGGYSRDIASLPDIASMAGLYVGWAPEGLRLLLGAGTVVLALALTAYVWTRQTQGRSVPLRTVGWLWFAWLLATPYAHFSDLMLLTPAVLAMLGPNGSQTNTALGATTLYLLLFSLLLINPIASHLYLLPVPVFVAGLLCFVESRRQPGETTWQLSARPAG
jgi:hypothetical protein